VGDDDERIQGMLGEKQRGREEEKEAMKRMHVVNGAPV
jgi:hypothetical protein